MQLDCRGCDQTYTFPVEIVVAGTLVLRCGVCGEEYIADRHGVRAPSEPPPEEATHPGPLLPAPRPRHDAGGLYQFVRHALRRRDTPHPAPAASPMVVRRAFGELPEGATEVVLLPPANAGDVHRAEEGSIGPSKRWLAVAAVAALCLGLGLGAVMLLGGDHDARPHRTVALDPAPPPAPRVATPRDTVAVIPIAVTALTARRAVVVKGALLNETDDPIPPPRIEAILVVDGKPRRRRIVACCDRFSPEELRAVAVTPGHPHYDRRRTGAGEPPIEPRDERLFMVVFPAVPPSLLTGDLDVKLDLLPPLQADMKLGG